MLKSVGMSKKGFNKMMNYECMLYGTKALLLGLPAAAVMNYLIWKAFTQGYMTDFVLPIKSMLIASFSVFAVVFATMLYSMHKIKKENSIDALKTDMV